MEQIQQAIVERILILDGALGTMFQQQQLTEEDFRGNLFTTLPAS